MKKEDYVAVTLIWRPCAGEPGQLVLRQLEQASQGGIGNAMAVQTLQFSASFEDHPHASKVVFGVPGGGKREFEKPILGGRLPVTTKRLPIGGVDETRRQEAARHYRRLMAESVRSRTAAS